MNVQQRQAVNPFITRKFDRGDVQDLDVESRLYRLKTFTDRQCLAALKLEHVQDTVRKALARRLRSLGIRACRKCGCTEARACAGGCWWVSLDVCSAHEQEALRWARR